MYLPFLHISTFFLEYIKISIDLVSLVQPGLSVAHVTSLNTFSSFSNKNYLKLKLSPTLFLRTHFTPFSGNVFVRRSYSRSCRHCWRYFSLQCFVSFGGDSHKTTGSGMSASYFLLVIIILKARDIHVNTAQMAV